MGLATSLLAKRVEDKYHTRVQHVVCMLNPEPSASLTCVSVPTPLLYISCNCRNLAIGIGIQNFPEGLAVSLPLRGAGMSVWKSFWYCVCITGNRIMPTDVYCGHHFTHAGMDN